MCLPIREEFYLFAFMRYPHVHAHARRLSLLFCTRRDRVTLVLVGSATQVKTPPQKHGSKGSLLLNCVLGSGGQYQREGIIVSKGYLRELEP